MSACFFLAEKTFAATDFISVVDPGNGADTDYTSLSAWEAGVQTDLTSGATQVFSGTRTSTIADNATVYLCRSGVYQTQSGTLVHATATQILIESITGGATEATNDVWYTNSTCNSSNYFTISNGGDSPIAIAKCRTSTGVADVTAVTIDGWTTSATNYIKVWTDPAENYRHSGLWDEGKYRLEYNDASVSLIDIEEAYVQVEGLQLYQRYGGSSSYNNGGILLRNNEATGVTRVSNNIIRGNPAASGSYEDGVQQYNTTNNTALVYNNIIYDFKLGSSNGGITNWSDTLYAYNNTIYNCNNGIFRNWGTVVVKNNISYANTDNYYGTFDASSTNNLSGPTQTDAPGSNPRNAQVVHFADEYNNDFHLDSADTGARNQGIILYDSGDDANLNFTTDIDNEARRDATGTWDIGADEAITKIYRSVGPSASTALASGGASTYGNLEIKPSYLSGSTTRVTDYIATFWRPLPDNVGVGDAIQYDDDGDEDIDTNDSIVFITRRIDASHYSVRTATGSAPTSTIEPDDNWSVFRSYTSLAKAESASANADENDSIDDDLENFDNWSNGRDLVTNQEQWNIAAYANGATADTTTVNIDGWTTSADSFIRVYTPSRTDEVGTSQRHSGVWDTSKYIIQSSNDTIFHVNEENVWIDGLEIQFTAHTSGNDFGIHLEAPGTCLFRVSNNIVRGTTNSSGYLVGIVPAYGAGSGTSYLWNNIIYDFTGSNGEGIELEDGQFTLYLYSNTIYNNTLGVLNHGGTIVAKNNLANGNTTDYSGAMANTANNISEDTSSPDVSYRNKVVTFIDESNRNLHIAVNDNAAKNSGADLTNDLAWREMMASEGALGGGSDIDGANMSNGSYPSHMTNLSDTPRPRGTSWDIGADELITKIYRSVAPEADGSMSAIDDDNSQADTLSIATSGTATFEVAVQDHIGVGDALIFDDDADNDLDASDTILFIHGRTDSTHYAVRDADGSLPDSATTDNDKWAIYRAYTSLSNAEAGTKNTAIPISFTGGNRDIAANSEQWNIACYANTGTNEADTTSVTIDGWTTAPQNYIRVYTPVSTSEVGTSQRHQGKWDGGKYVMNNLNSDNHILIISDSNVKIDGIQFIVTYGNSNSAIDTESSSASIFISNSIFKSLINSSFGIAHDQATTIYIFNNIFHDIAGTNSGGIALFDTVGINAYIYNNTFNKVYYGINLFGSDTRATAKNNLYQSGGLSGSDGFYGYVEGLLNSDYNLSDLAGDAPGANSRNSTNVTFLDEANGDFHLSSTDTGARGYGRNLGNEQYQISNIQYDIDGNPRPALNTGFNWDIGADQSATPIYRSVAPSKTDYLDRGVDEAGTDLSISGTTLTLENAAPDNVGVGDAIQYDSDGNDTLDAIAFISGRTSGTSYTVQSRDGGAPVPVTNDQNWAIYRAYTSLSNAEGGTENSGLDNITEEFDRDVGAGGGKDIYASNQQWNIAAYANGTTADTVAVDISGWTTEPTNYIKVYTPVLASEVGTSQRHQGRWDNGRWRMEVTNRGVTSYEENIRIDGLQIYVSSPSNSSDEGIDNLASGAIDYRVSNNIVRSAGTLTADTYIYGIRVCALRGTAKIWNNIVYGFKGSSMTLPGGMGMCGGYNNSTVTSYIYNNTVFNNSNGFYQQSGGSPVNIIKNNLSYNNTDNYSGTFHASSTNNLSGPTQTDAPGSNPQNAKVVKFVDEAGKDFHLDPTDIAARNLGADLSADTYLAVTTDIDGKTRPNQGAFDIGADEAAKGVYYSVGQNTTDHGSGGNITISNGLATFTVAQTASNLGVGDKVTYNGSTIAYLMRKVSTTQWYVVTATGTIPADVGSAQAVNSIAHAYASLSAAEAGAPDSSHLNTSDLVANDYQLNLPCYYDTGPDTTAVTVDGYTTSASNFIKIYTPIDTNTEANSRQRHWGKWDDGKYNLSITNATGITVQTNYAKIDGIQVITVSPTGNSNHGIVQSGTLINGGNELDISNSIIRGHGSATYSQTGIDTGANYSTIKIWNTLVYGIATAATSFGIRADNYAAPVTVTVNNSTVIGGTYAINNVGRTLICKNCYASSPGTAYNATKTSCASSDDSGSEGLQNILVNTTNFTNVTSGQEDYHLPSGSALRNVGANLSNDSSAPFSTDIDGNTRNVDSRGWDIGADEAATPVYYSVGQDGTTDRKVAATVDITNGLATFSAPQTGNIGVGDVIDYASGSKAYITGKQDTSNWYVQSATGTSITGVDDATVNSIKRVFTSLSSAETGAGGPTLLNTSDLYTNNYQLNLPCYYDTGPDTTAVTVDGWTTGIANYVRIYTPIGANESNQSQRHNGKWEEGKWRHEKINSDNLYVNDDYVKLDGLQLKNTSNNDDWNYAISLIDGVNQRVWISNNIIRGVISGNSDISRGINLAWSATPGQKEASIWNNIIYGWKNGNYAAFGLVVNSTWDAVYAYNNTVYDSNVGFSSFDANDVFKNNLAYSNTTDYSGTYSAQSTNNLSQDGTAPAWGSYYRNATVKFTDQNSHDFHLAPDDTAARNAGADLSADANLAITNDIDGNSRPTLGAFDIGADEGATAIYYSVGQNTNDHSSGGNVSITSGVATFTVPQTATNLGIGDKLTAGGNVYYLAKKNFTASWNVITATGAVPGNLSSTAVTSIAHAYASLSDAEAGATDSSHLNTSNLVTGNYQLNFPCYYDSGPDTTAVGVYEWETGSANYIKIYTPNDTTTEVNQTQRHSGKWDDLKFRMENSLNALTMNILEPHVRIDGLQMKNTHNGADSYGIYLNSGYYNSVPADFYVSNNIVYGAGSSPAIGVFIYNISAGGVARVWNNLVYGWSNLGYQGSIQMSTNNAFAYIYNNTINTARAGFGIRGERGTTVAKNNIAEAGGSDFYESFTNSDYNISADATAPGSHSKTNATVAFIDAANKDFHLSMNDTAAKGYGMNLMNDSYLAFQNDIDGQERTGEWSIGADDGPFTQIQTPPPGPTANPNLDINDGLVLYQSFDGPDISGTTSYDRSGNNNHGTISGATPAVGKRGQGMSFDGVDDGVSANYSAVSGAYTTSFWVKKIAIGQNDYIISHGLFQNFLYSDQGGGARLWFITDGTVGGSADTDCLTNDTNWHFIVGVNKGDNTQEIYCDGQLDGQATETPNGSVSSLIVGAGNGTYTNANFDEVRVYNRALSPDEIAHLYRLGEDKVGMSLADKNADGLVGHWTFDGADISGSTAEDRSGQGNNGTISGATPATGKKGQGMSFDGVDDYISIGDKPDLNFERNQPFSVIAWIKQSDTDSGHIISKMLNSGTYRGWDLRTNIVGEVQFILRSDLNGGNFLQTRADNFLDADTWTHFAVIYDGSSNANGVKMYKNGISQTAYIEYNGLTGSTMTASGVYINARSGEQELNKGATDDLRVYDRALSPEEVGDLFRLGEAKIRN